jgi:hypothetical protein
VGDDVASTPDFGATFNVPYVKYDEMGHISNSGTRTVTIPQGSLTDTASTTNTANVLTSIDFIPNTGAIDTEHKNVGALVLTDYSTVNADTAYVQSTDSINAAFNKVDKRIDNLNTSLTKKINDLDYKDTTATSQIVYGVSQTDGQIAVDRKAVGELIISGYTKPTSISAGVSSSDSINTAIGKLDYSLTEEIGRAKKAESELQAQINTTDKAVQALTNGTSTEEIDSVMELVTWTEEHGKTTQSIINAIGQKAEGEKSSTGIYSLIDAEIAARTLADENITKRIDDLPAKNITAAQITKWEKAEENI